MESVIFVAARGSDLESGSATFSVGAANPVGGPVGFTAAGTLEYDLSDTEVDNVLPRAISPNCMPAPAAISPRASDDALMRLTVGAAHVRSSMMRYFDSKEMDLAPSHIMASGALPPAFPAVRIDGELYWDGGILSNTPTERISK